MPQPTTTLHLPQPCAESWAAMAPRGAGRHCAACQQVVVDFTQHTDAELLAYFRAAPTTCGRFRADQLDRPLHLPARLPGRRRWSAWLALALAAWAPRLAEAAPTPTRLAVPAKPARRTPPTRRASSLAVKYVRGTVHDATTHEPLAGVAVFLKGEHRTTITDSSGRFALQLPARRPRGGRTLLLHFTGYESRAVRLPVATRPPAPLGLLLRPDPAAAGVQVVGHQVERRVDVLGGAPVLLVNDDERPNQPAATQPTRSLWQRLKRLFKK